jgi:hypothetical protein
LAKDAKPKTVAEAMERASKLSQLTTPGSVPFHLKATISEPDSTDSDYKAEIEEHWLAPDKWRQTIKTPDFSQTLIVNGEKISEQNQGDYYPLWLRDLVTAIFDLAPTRIKQLQTPLPDLAALQEHGAQNLPPALRNFRIDTGTSCDRSKEEVGIPPVQNSVFTSICFENPSGLLVSVVSPEYDAEFRDFKQFKEKKVAMKISIVPEPGTKIEARITELTELKAPDPVMFAIQTPTPGQDRIGRARVSEAVARGMLLTSPEIAWLPVRDGKTSGTLSLAVSIDKQGHVRETWPLNSDNPFPQDQARKTVAQWSFKPFLMDGVPGQMETILTFAFQTKIDNPVPVLSDAEARKLAIETAEPVFVMTTKPPAGTEFTVRVAVDETGKIIGLKNPNHLDAGLLGAANVALHKWRFRPYIHEGRPDRFDADVTFRTQ